MNYDSIIPHRYKQREGKAFAYNRMQQIDIGK